MRRLAPLLTLLLTAAAAAAPATTLAGQTPGRAPALLGLPASTEAAGRGDAFDLSAGGHEAVFYNPAALGGGGFSASAQWYRSGSALLTASTGMNAWIGNVGFGLQTLGYGISDADPSTFPSSEAAFVTEGPVGVSEVVLSAGLARRVGPVRAGITGKYLDVRLDGEREGAAAVDAGVTWDPGPVTLGLAARNIGSDLEFAGGEAPLPFDLTLGASTGTDDVGPLDVSASAAVTLRDDDEVVPGGGLQVSYWPIQGRTFAARIGYRRVVDGPGWGLTFGGGVELDGFALEYAYRGFDDLDGGHRIGIRWR